jgi:cysteine desulfurase
MLVNNETGVIQPVRQIGEIARSRNILLHTDAVQAAGKIPVDVDHLNVDLMSLSAHKVYGPKGVGALYVRKGTSITPLISGGSHEHGLRAGTENVAGIVGFSEALSLTMRSMQKDCLYVSSLRDLLEEKIKEKIIAVRINGDNSERVCNTSSISFLSIEAESILLHLDIKGIYASSGSACTTGSSGPSHVLGAMGLNSREAQSTLRFSLGPDNTRQEIENTVDNLVEITGRLREISSVHTAVM